MPYKLFHSIRGFSMVIFKLSPPILCVIMCLFHLISLAQATDSANDENGPIAGGGNPSLGVFSSSSRTRLEPNISIEERSALKELEIKLSSAEGKKKANVINTSFLNAVEKNFQHVLRAIYENTDYPFTLNAVLLGLTLHKIAQNGYIEILETILKKYQMKIELKQSILNKTFNTAKENQRFSVMKWIANQLNLGNLGNIKIINDDEKDSLLELYCSALSGNKIDQYRLGLYYRESDTDEAMYWFQLAADQGLKDAQYALGRCYEFKKQDFNQAVQYYRRAADQNLSSAQNALGRCYDDGIGVSEDVNEAVRWYQLSAHQGDAAGQYSLGRCYENGRGVEKNFSMAFAFYGLSAAQHYARAKNALGRCYEHRRGVEKDLEIAKDYYKLAADQNDASAQCALGRFYEEGRGGLKKNIPKAMQLYEASANQNFKEAKEALDRLQNTQSVAGGGKKKR